MLTCPGCGDLWPAGATVCGSCRSRLLPTSGDLLAALGGVPLLFACGNCQLDWPEAQCDCCGAHLSTLVPERRRAA